MGDIKEFININNIINCEKNFIRYVNSIKLFVCEILIDEIENKIIDNNTFIYTGHKEWLKLVDNNLYNIEYKNIKYNVWFCESVSVNYVLENEDIKNKLCNNNIIYLKSITTNIKKCNFINGRCSNSMFKLDDLHRKYINKHKFKKNEIVAIKAVAGSGKTTTLLNLAKENKNKKILYLAFNKSLIEEIKNKLKKENIKNLYPVTFDALMRNTYIKHYEEPKLIDLKPGNLGDIIEWFNKKPYRVKNAYVSKFNKFCNQLKYNKIEDYCKKELKKEDNLLIKLWKKTITQEFQTFNSIRKHVEINNLCKDYIDNIYDLIFIDEAQDFDNLMLKILLEDTRIPKLFVGDSNQAIYEWRGCINAFEKLPKNTIYCEFYSTFRIGEPACADIAKQFKNCWMISKSKNNTNLEYNKTPINNYIYLFRTWKSLLLTAQNTENIWIYNYDKQKQTIEKLHHTLQKYKLSEDEMNAFEDDLPAFLVKMSHIELERLLNNIENNITTKDKSNCKMYTIHSYKGLEDDIIRIYNDIDIKKENNLYYVALTRGKKQIILDNNDINKEIEILNNNEINDDISIKSNEDIDIDKFYKEMVNSKPKKIASYIITMDLFKKGLNLEQIAIERKIKIQTIYEHLIKNVRENGVEFYYKLMDNIMSKEIYKEIKNTINICGLVSLKVLKEYMNSNISYNDIKLIVELEKYIENTNN